MSALRLALVLPPSLLFVYFAGKDLMFHLRGRRVGGIENAIHLGLGLAEAAFLGGALVGSAGWLAAGAIATAALGAGDEYLFHRDLPAAESDLHAKGHLALFLVLAAAVLADHAH